MIKESGNTLLNKHITGTLYAEDLQVESRKDKAINVSVFGKMKKTWFGGNGTPGR